MKSRDISMPDFLDILQIEYYQAEFKKYIHHSPKNKLFWKKVMLGKREKILDISMRMSNLDNIFDSADTADEYRARVFPSAKHIAFQFELSDEEVELYYSIGSHVKVEVEPGVFLSGKIEEIYFASTLASIRIRGRAEPSKHLFSKFFRVF